MNDSRVPPQLPCESQSKTRLLLVDLIIVAFVGGCVLWDRAIYAAGYRINEEVQHFGAGPLVGALVLATVLLCRLVLLRRDGLALAAIRLAILLVAGGYAVSRVGHDPFMNGFRDRIRASIDPNELQAWAMASIPDKTPKEGEVIHFPAGKEIHLTRDAVDPDGNYFSLPPESLPESVKRLRPQRTPGILVWVSGNPSQKHVELMFGRRWGLYVGSSAFRAASGNEWIPGVYFYSAPN